MKKIISIVLCSPLFLSGCGDMASMYDSANRSDVPNAYHSASSRNQGGHQENNNPNSGQYHAVSQEQNNNNPSTATDNEPASTVVNKSGAKSNGVPLSAPSMQTMTPTTGQ